MQTLTPYRPPLQNRLARAFLRPVFRGLFHLLARVEVQGLQNVPRGSAYIAAFNHVSVFDPPFVLAFWQEDIEILGASDIWERAAFGQNILVRLFGGIPVHRGEFDRAALQKTASVLRGGSPLLLAPEGGRTHQPAMRKALPGIAHLVEETGAPVVPVGVSGTSDDFFKKALAGSKPPLRLHIGKPLQLPPLTGKGEARRRARQANTDLVMTQIAGLLPPEYGGYYAKAGAGLPS